MFDSKALGASSQPFLPDSLASVRNRRDLSQTAIGPQRQHEQNLSLLRQLRGRWTTLLESEQTAKLKQESATYLSRLAPHEHIQGRELRLLQQMTAGTARPTLSEQGTPREADPKKALKDLDKKIRSLSARTTEGGEPTNPAQISRAELQVFGTQQPMKSGTFQGVNSELRAQRDSEAQAETLAQRPEPKTHTIGSQVRGALLDVVQNRTTLPFEATPPSSRGLGQTKLAPRPEEGTPRPPERLRREAQEPRLPLLPGSEARVRPKAEPIQPGPEFPPQREHLNRPSEGPPSSLRAKLPEKPQENSATSSQGLGKPKPEENPTVFRLESNKPKAETRRLSLPLESPSRSEERPAVARPKAEERPAARPLDLAKPKVEETPVARRPFERLKARAQEASAARPFDFAKAKTEEKPADAPASDLAKAKAEERPTARPLDLARPKAEDKPAVRPLPLEKAKAEGKPADVRPLDLAKAKAEGRPVALPVDIIRPKAEDKPAVFPLEVAKPKAAEKPLDRPTQVDKPKTQDKLAVPPLPFEKAKPSALPPEVAKPKAEEKSQDRPLQVDKPKRPDKPAGLSLENPKEASSTAGLSAGPKAGVPEQSEVRLELPKPATLRAELQSPLDVALRAQKQAEARARELKESRLEEAKKDLPRPGTPEDVQRLREEAPPPPPENKALQALRSLAPLTTVKAVTLDKAGEARTRYPEWLQVKLSEDATPAYMTSLPGLQRGPKPIETQPLKVPQQSVDALTKTDFRRADELREMTGQQQKTAEAVAQPAAPVTAAKATQLIQAVVGQGFMAPQKPVQDGPKSSEAPRRSVYGEEKDKGGIAPVSSGPVSGPAGAGRISGKSEIIETRGLGAVLSGSVGKRDGAESKASLPNLAAGWAASPPADNGAKLSSGRSVSAESPIHSPALDDLALRLKQGKPLPVVAAEPEKPRPLFFDQSEDHHPRFKEEDAKLERLEKSGHMVQAFHQVEARHNLKKREEGGGAEQHAHEKVEDVQDHSQRGKGGGGGGGGQQKERDHQAGQQAGQVQDQQQFQAQRRTQSDSKMELQRLEAYRLAKTDEALKLGLKMSTQPEGRQLSELMNRHAGHNMESLLKKAYRLDSLGELDRDDAVNALGLVLKMGGEFTFAHSARVLELAMDLADEVGVNDKNTRSQVRLGSLLKDTGEMALMLDEAPPSKLEKMSDWLGSQDLRQAGLLHDIGKTRVPPEILYKPGKLTEEEYEIMKLHPVIGERMVYPIESLRHLCPVIRGHHEKWDGSGYPDGLKGEDIPYASRIIAIADVFDALHAERPYKAGMPVGRVQAILKEGRGTHFDPDLLDAFERVIQRRHPELNNPFA